MKRNNQRTSNLKAQAVWVVVKVESGVPAELKVYANASAAKRCLSVWRKTARDDYDSVEQFCTQIK